MRRLQEFQHGAIRILRRSVALDHIVQGAADQELRVAWIREQVAIGDMDAAAQGGIAGDRAMLAHQRAPEERQQLLASRLRRRRPITLVELVVLEPLSRLQLRSQDGGVHAKKHLLDARAIERDQHRPPAAAGPATAVTASVDHRETQGNARIRHRLSSENVPPV